MPTICSPHAAQEALQAGKGSLIDVRSPAEFRAVHAVGARLHPLDRLDAGALIAGRQGTLYLICHSGARARQAAERLAAAGCEDVAVIEGGTKAWEAAALPVEKGKAHLPLDRQMQLTVGTLIMAGCALTHWVSPWFLLLPAFVGLGLFNAGATGICPLAMVIGMMPWNRGEGGGSCCAPQRT